MTNPSTIASDQPSEDDHLDFTDFKGALLNIITQAETPLTVGIFGAWGSGKSTLMKMLRNEIETEGLHGARTVWFTAWKYDREEALWRALILRTIAALYPRENEPADIPREERPLLQSPSVEEQELIDLLERLEESVYQPVSWDEVGERNINWWQLISNVVQAGVSTSANIASLTVMKKWLGGDDFPEDEIKAAAKAISREVKTNHRRQLLEMERFEQTFTEAVAETFGKDKDGELKGRLIVFVDDLDRCMPEKAIEILEAIKLFLAVPGTLFVLAADQRVIQKGIEARYGALFSQTPDGNADNLPIHGASYMQKIIQIPFHLPALSVGKMDEYIQKSMGNIKLSAMTRQVFARGSNPNPRQIKRALNIFQLLREIARARQARQKREKLKVEKIAWPLLAKAVLVQTQYPKLYQEWRQMPTLLQSLERKYGQKEREGGQYKPQADVEMADAESVSVREAAEESDTLAPYMAREYALLRQMMQYPSPEEAGKGQQQARFEGLNLEQMAAYVHLAGSAAAETIVTPAIDSNLMADMVSGDSALIDNAAAHMKEIEEERQKKLKKNETLTHPEAEQLVRVLENKQESMKRRVSAGDALATVGDPRFAADRWQLPADEMAGFVEVPAGAFQMGDKNEKRELPMYYIGKYAVTTAQFKAFVEDDKHEPEDKDSLRGRSNHPVIWITWHDAIAYCDWLTKRLRTWKNAPAAFLPIQKLLKQEQAWRVTLPSEAEWEKAGRGKDGRLYPWGNEFDADKANTEESGLGRATAVGCFPAGASPYDCLDMSGNVWEWTRSHYEGGGENLDAGDDVARVLRGGSSWDDAAACGLARRNLNYPYRWNDLFGLRVVVSPFFTSDR